MRKVVPFYIPVLMLLTAGNPKGSFYGVDEKPGTQLPISVKITDHKNDTFNLVELIDIPTLIVPTYFHCPGHCHKLFDGVVEIIEQSSLKPGVHYRVITLSIDGTDTPAQGAIIRENNLQQLPGNIPDGAWLFAVSDTSSIRQFSRATGWHFSPNGDGFVHPLTTLLLTPEGRISHYFYGTFFMPMHFEMAVMAAWKGEFTSTRIKNIKYCYNYDVKSHDKARQWILGGGMVIMLLTILLLIIMLKRKE